MLLLGCIADDFTGGTDIALTLVRGGMRTVQVIGVPPAGGALPEADAVVVSLKSRTSPVADAVAESVAGADALLAAGARQLVFKYCSTFDSTDAGNIGPVAEALLERVGGGITLACPAFPENGRTVYQGHLFVGTVLLSESPLKDHPLTPMRDPDLVRVLQRQTRAPVGLVPYGVVEKGPEAIAIAFKRAGAAGQRIVIVDALSDRHLRDIATAAADFPLITGGSGIAIGLPDNFRRRGLLTTTDAIAAFSAPPGRAAILAGSCSQATLGQIAAAKEAGLPALALDALDLCAGTVTVADIVRWAAKQSPEQPLLIYSSADPEVITRVQERMGREQAGAVVETDDGGGGRRAGFDRRDPNDRRRRRNLGRGGRRARRLRPGDRPGDRSRRAVDPCARRAAVGAGAQIGQLRRP